LCSGGYTVDNSPWFQYPAVLDNLPLSVPHFNERISMCDPKQFRSVAVDDQRFDLDILARPTIGSNTANAIHSVNDASDVT
jgi:hypothetical protein